VDSFTSLACPPPGKPGNKPNASFDTLIGSGSGTLNSGKTTYNVDFTLTDLGEPGTGTDTVNLKIYSGSMIILISGADAATPPTIAPSTVTLTGGNQQAHSSNGK
jgi:hypothetical protein